MAQITEYQKDLIEALKDPREAAAYLNAALEEGDKDAFLLALRNIAEANGGMKAVAEKAHLNRERVSIAPCLTVGIPKSAHCLICCMGLVCV